MDSLKIRYKLLKDFLRQFCPPVKYEGKYNHNEFSYFHATIAKIFLQQANITITPLQFLKCLNYSGYITHVREGESGLPKNLYSLSRRKRPRTSPFFYLEEEVYAYINVSSATVFKLQKSTRSIKYFRNPETKAEIQLRKEKIIEFFSKYNQNKVQGL